MYVIEKNNKQFMIKRPTFKKTELHIYVQNIAGHTILQHEEGHKHQVSSKIR